MAAETSSRILVLASNSPRRYALLREAGYRFRRMVPEVLEPGPEEADPEAYAAATSWLKARDVARRWNDGPAAILAADTVVAIGRRILGKPKDRADARRILMALSGQKHHVYTGVCLWLLPEDRWLGGVARSELVMRRWSEDALEAYLDSGDWEGKAGAYGIQDNDHNVTLLAGSYTNVVGLPMELIVELFEAVGIRPDR